MSGGRTSGNALAADDHTMFREGLAGLLTTYGGLQVVGETTNDQGAVARELKPDVVITQGTVKRHLHNCYHKMEVGSRGEAVRKALREERITITYIG